MAPKGPLNNGAYRSFANAKLTSQGSLRLSGGKAKANRDCIRLGELSGCVVRSVATAPPMPPLRIAVGNVFRMSSEKEMGWANTGRHIAPVANAKSFWYFADISDCPGNTVRGKCPACDFNLSVAIFKFGRRPDPAVTGPVDLAPKTRYCFFVHGNLSSCGSKPDRVAAMRASLKFVPQKDSSGLRN